MRAFLSLGQAGLREAVIHFVETLSTLPDFVVAEEHLFVAPPRSCAEMGKAGDVEAGDPGLCGGRPKRPFTNQGARI